MLVTTSSEFQDDARLVRCALEGLADEPLRVVVTAPSLDPAEFDIPANARVLEFAPHAPLLERAACAVPFGRDQFEVARRVEVAGAGARLPARRLSAARLREKVREAIGARAGAKRVADGYRAAGGGVAAAGALEDLLTSAARVPS